MTPDQIRMARAKLDLTRDDIKQAIGIDTKTLGNAEKGVTSLQSDNYSKLKLYFESHGLEFTDYNGVRETPSGLRLLRGRAGFHEMYDLLFDAVRKGNHDLWLWNGTSSLVSEGLGSDFVEMHKGRMEPYRGKLDWRVVVEEGDDTFFGHEYAYYRWIGKEFFNNKTVYVFGSCVGFVDFEDEVSITLIDKEDVADTVRLWMTTVWDTHAHDPDTEKPFRPR